MSERICHEFIDTGRCGHSDSEHDAMTERDDTGHATEPTGSENL